DRAPQPGLGGLEELLEAARTAGTEVALTVTGPRTPLAAGVDLTAYRIVQEALTNARRHASGAAVAVTLRYAPGAPEIDIPDDGPGGTGGTDGHGIVGMRERAAMVGGTLTAGPADGGGFVVHAQLPLEGRPG